MSKAKLLAKLKIYEEAETIMVFDSLEDARNYYNTYDYQNFSSIEEMKTYVDEYGFELDGNWYHINYEFALKEIHELLKAYEEHITSYAYFVEHLEDFVGKKVEFTTRFKADGKEFKAERYVQDAKSFAMPKEDSLIEVTKVKILN